MLNVCVGGRMSGIERNGTVQSTGSEVNSRREDRRTAKKGTLQLQVMQDVIFMMMIIVLQILSRTTSNKQNRTEQPL